MQLQIGVDDIAARLDRLPITRLHLFIVGLCGVGFFFDLFEIALGSSLSAVFSAPPLAPSPRQLSLLLASIYVGAAIGAPLSGFLADRMGRRKVLVSVLLWLALTSACAAASQSLAMLIVFRGLSGLALGAYWPLVAAYLTDILPPRRRGALIFIMVAVATLGPVVGIFLLRWLTPIQPMGIEAWRWTFLGGSVGAVAAAILFVFLPESARWLEAKGQSRLADAACARFERSAVVLPRRYDAHASPQTDAADDANHTRPNEYRGMQPALFSMVFFLSSWSTVAFPVLSGAVLMHKGYRLSDALLYIALSQFGPCFGTVAAACVVDFVGRKTALMMCALVMIVSGFAFCTGDTQTVLITSGFIYTLFCVFYVTILNVYSGEIIPTPARASALSKAWALNRIGSAIAPMLLLPLMHRTGVVTMFSVIAATLIGSLLLLLVMPHGRTGLAVR